MGWRYLYFTSGALVLIMSALRIFVIRFHETPKFSLCKGEDEEVVALLQKLATTYGRQCDLTVDDLKAKGSIETSHASKSKFSVAEIWVHYKGLFSTRILGWSTTLIWLSWTFIGLAYPLFYVFLPEYLASRGAKFGEPSAYITWRNYVLAQFCSIFGPLVAAYLSKIPWIGRKYTMVVGSMLSSESQPRLCFSVCGLTGCSGFLLCLHGCSQQRRKCGFQLRHLLRDQHLLRYFVRIQSRGVSIATSRNRQWYCCRLESRYGHHVGSHRNFCKHIDLSSDIYMRGSVHCHGWCGYTFPF